MSHSILFVLGLLLFQLSFCDDVGCLYRSYQGQPLDKLNITNDKYLSSRREEENIQKCFSLSNSDVFNRTCCYKKNINENRTYCIDSEGQNLNDPNIQCPQDTVITNNCGMALYYQPVSYEVCTDISLVDGFCCLVKVKNKGSACLKQDTIDEDNKDKITDYMKNYLKNTYNVDKKDIEMVDCKGYFFKYYGLLLLLLAVMYL